MGMWNESSLFIFHVQHAQLTNQSTMLSGFIFSLSSRLCIITLILICCRFSLPRSVIPQSSPVTLPRVYLFPPLLSIILFLPFSHPLNHIATVSSNPIKKLEAETEHPIRRAPSVDTSNPSNYASHPITQSNGSIISFFSLKLSRVGILVSFLFTSLLV